MKSENSHYKPLLSLLAKEKCDDNNPLWSKISLEIQSRRKSSMVKKNRRCRRISMKRRARLDRTIKPLPLNAFGRKVRTLKKLIPNCESMGAERLFQETADYILSLQMRVKAMQIMVNVLSKGSDF